MRAGNFNSSTIVALLSSGVRDMTPEELAARPKKGKGSKTTTVEDTSVLGESALTYIEECNLERRLNRCLENENNARPCAWGKLTEIYVQSKDEYLPLAEYEQRSDEPEAHPDFDYWTGTPDMTKADTVSELKCPYTLKSFCHLVQPLYDGLEGMDAMNAIRFGYTDSKGIEHKKHADGEKYYQQLVSNSCIKKKKYAELIIFCPYESELPEIKVTAQQQDGEQCSRFFGIVMSDNEDLPYLPDGGYYKNLNFIKFEVPQSDKDALTERIKLAGTHLETIKMREAA